MEFNIINANGGGTNYVNGKKYTLPRGGNVTIKNNEVRVNGVRVWPDGETPDSPNAVKEVPVIVELRITNDGILQSVQSDVDVSVTGNVGGGVTVGRDLDAKDIGGGVTAGRDVDCGKVGGGVMAGRDVSTRR